MWEEFITIINKLKKVKPVFELFQTGFIYKNFQ